MTDREFLRKYLLNKLSEDEKVLFHKNMQHLLDSPMLEEEIAYLKGRKELKQQLIKIGDTLKAKSKKRLRKIYRYSIAGIAATLAILLTLQLFDSNSSQQIYNDFYTAYPNVYSYKGSSDPDSLLTKSAMHYYEKKQFQKTVAQFQKINSSRDLSSVESFYYGIACMEIEDFNSATEQLMNVQKKSILYNDAQWYLALAYIKNNNYPKAIVILKSLVSETGKSRKEAIQKLLNKIEN